MSSQHIRSNYTSFVTNVLKVASRARVANYGNCSYSIRKNGSKSSVSVIHHIYVVKLLWLKARLSGASVCIQLKGSCFASFKNVNS